MPSTPDPGIPRPAGLEPLVPAEQPGESNADATGALRLVARREHEILALAELSQELTISLDLFGVGDLVLFNLMGQLGTSRAALWLVSEADPRVPVLLRSHGIPKRIAAAIGDACAPWILDRLERERRIVLAAELDSIPAAPGVRLARAEEIALFAPILTRGELVGVLAIGPRIAQGAYGAVELQVLQTSLGMVGVALQNTKLYNRLLENNRRLRLANENLQELDRLKSAFLSNVNHELRTPLTVVIGSIDCLLQSEPPGSRTHEFLHAALDEARKLKGLLERLLEFSEVRRDVLEFRIEEGDVAAAVRAFYEERLPGVTETMRELTFHASPDLPRARFDRQRLFQVLDALVDNAVKFTAPGANIAIGISVPEDAGRCGVEVAVADDGPGIARDQLAALFDSFQQVDGSATRRIGGMGLGLALARELAEKMGGSLTVDSEIGNGSRFSLFLPAA
ncbi:MAG: ATP-binding protein [Bacteroidota bacterium]